MKLTIWTGRPGGGKRERVYHEAARTLLRGEDALILVPEQFTLEAENLLIRALGRPGFLGSNATAKKKSPFGLSTRIIESEYPLG